MSRGLISPELPYSHKKAVEMLADPDRETAGRQIVEGIENSTARRILRFITANAR
jgi:hypothetical protein